MPKFSPDEYKSYLQTRFKLINERTLLCQKIMTPLPSYDYWTYNYAYYLYTLNAEELNHLRYLFGSKITHFYEFTTYGHMRKYLQEINWHGIPKNRDFTRGLGLPYFISRHLCIIHPNFGLPVVVPTSIPPAFEPIETHLQLLHEQLIQLAEEYPELTLKPEAF